ncbi:lipoprotein-releasing ABC transporter permease subunit [Halotalea alkalilenta]|uniref:lipoprotein-releasing ABC transporter permease subunit n=1 Tax=Halotalea alkalilenta TaxID=376489 RepID=UPI000483607F|nr:lipoprotein-releasing ABC transporter permease subunit [Halotalea alkalilenta]
MLDRIPFLIGLRYTRAKRRNHFISFISMTSMLGLTLGVAVLILVLSVMNGFDHELRSRVLGMVPHTKIEQQGGVQDWQAFSRQLEQYPHVIASAPYVEQQGMFTSRGRNSGAQVTGIDPALEPKVSIVANHMVQGDLDDLQPGSWNVVLGELLARSLGVGVGDRVTLLVPEASITPGGVFPRLRAFTVSGIFSVGAQLDGSLAYANLQDMQALARLDAPQGIRLQLDDLFQAHRVTQQIIDQLPYGFRGMDWTYTQGNLFQAIQMEKHLIGLLLTVIVAVAAFNIVSTLVMVVTDKRADIAILRTLGATPRTIMGIFVVQGLTIGLVGILLGLVFGVLLALSISEIIAWVQNVFGIQFLDPNVYFISYLPSRIELSDLGVIVGVAFVLSFLSTLYPAWRASRVQPAEVLRYE